MRGAKKSDKSQASTFLMTPDQHREQAAILRRYDPEATEPQANQAEALAAHHENLANLIEQRQSEPTGSA